MKRIISHFKLVHGRRQRGSIMILTAVMISAIIAMMALAIDLGFIFSLRSQYQNGIDAAALAGGSGLRVTIEDANSTDPPQQRLVVRQLAKEYANLNEVRRYSDPPQDPAAPPKPNANSIVIDDAAITLNPNTDPPTVTVDSTIQLPTLFAGIVGLYDVNVRAKATASLFPVDGGTGTLASGTDRNAGCWRPIFLPDTFYDSSGIPHVLFENNNGERRVPKPSDGDYYRSRFAAGARRTAPFFADPPSAAGQPVTGLRDTQLGAEIGTKTIMGKQFVTFEWDSYFVANFSLLPRVTFDPLGPTEAAKFGYCGQIRVGDRIPVFPRADSSKADEVRRGLASLMEETIDFDKPYPTEESIYRYVTSNIAPGPNTHGAIIPVLFYDPLLFDKNQSILTVTNFGLFLLKELGHDGSLNGYFVREIIAGGTPIAATNIEADAPPGFKRGWLPMAVQLLR